MTDRHVEHVARRLEAFSQRHPFRYRVALALVAALGYAYVLAVATLVLAIGARLLQSWSGLDAAEPTDLLLLAGYGLAAGVVLRAVWIRVTPPAGMALSQDEAPRLFLLIDKLSAALGTPAFDRILIVDDLTLSVEPLPRLGPFGWSRVSLRIGLPLLLTLTPVQFRAMLAHEFGHLGSRHGRFSAWIYRTRMVWTRILDELPRRRRWASIFFLPFLRWYAPFFSAYSFTLARAQEYEADRQAARLVGPGDMMAALMTRALLARMIDELYWPAINRRTITDPMPPASHLEELTALFHRLPSPQTIQGWMNEALHGATGYADTHPSLADRLAALRALPDHPREAVPTEPQLRKAGEPSAADYYLGTYLTAVRDALDEMWVESVTDEWEHKHREMAAARARCQELSDKSATVGLSLDELWEYACQMEALESGRAALPLLQRLLAKDPTHAQANLALGRLLLAQDDAAGLAHLEQAVAKDPRTVIQACALASAFLERRGQHKDALRYRIRAHRHRQRLLDAEPALPAPRATGAASLTPSRPS